MRENEPIENSDFYLKCQLLRLFDGAALPLNILDKIYLKGVRLKSALIRRLKKGKVTNPPKTLVKTIVEHNKNKSDGEEMIEQKLNKPNSTAAAQGGTLKAGDLVEVLSMEEIKKLLNEKNETQGLAFMPEQEKFCGMQTRVIKRVNFMFDERERVMRKIKNVVILEGVICSGEGMFDAEACDRGCFLFWKESWLKKISD